MERMITSCSWLHGRQVHRRQSLGEHEQTSLPSTTHGNLVGSPFPQSSWVLGVQTPPLLPRHKRIRSLPGPGLVLSSFPQPSCHTLQARYCQYCLERAPTVPSCFFTASYLALPHGAASVTALWRSSSSPRCFPLLPSPPLSPSSSSSKQQAGPRQDSGVPRPIAARTSCAAGLGARGLPSCLRSAGAVSSLPAAVKYAGRGHDQLSPSGTACPAGPGTAPPPAARSKTRPRGWPLCARLQGRRGDGRPEPGSTAQLPLSAHTGRFCFRGLDFPCGVLGCEFSRKT